MLTQFLVEAVIQDGDGLASADEGDNQWVEKDLSLVRVPYDRERASAKTLKKETLEEELKKISEAHAVYSVTGERVFSTLEQELSMMSRLVDIEKNGTLFYIFHNPRVAATEQFKPPKIEEGYLEKLENAWAKNIRILSEYYSSKYDIKAFQEREVIRNKLAEQIAGKLAISLPYMAFYFRTPSFKQEIIERLRGRQYFERSDQIKQSDLSNPDLIRKIVGEEHARASLIKFSQNCDRIILNLINKLPNSGNQSACAKKLYQYKSNTIDGIAKSRRNLQGKLQPLSKKDVGDLTFGFKKSIREAFEEIQTIDKIKELVEGLVDQKLEFDNLLSSFYGEINPYFLKIIEENLSEDISHLKWRLCLEFGYHFLRDAPDKLKQLLGTLYRENIFDSFKPGVDWGTLQYAVTLKGYIVNSEVVKAALWPFLKQKYLRRPMAYVPFDFAVKNSWWFFYKEVPNEKNRKIQFLKDEINFMFQSLNLDLQERTSLWHLSPPSVTEVAFTMQDGYLDARSFLETVDARFNKMVTKLGLSEQDIKTVREDFNTDKSKFERQWEAMVPKIRKIMSKAFAKDSILGRRVLADVFPSNFFASSRESGLRAFSDYDCLLGVEDNFETNLKISIRPDNLFFMDNDFFMESDNGPATAFNKKLAEKCVQYYTDLFRVYAEGHEIPKISLIPPKSQSDFRKNMYLVNIEFENKKEKEYFLASLCRDCYDPALEWEVHHININQSSKVTIVQQSHLKRLSELAEAAPSSSAQPLVLSEKGRLVAGGPSRRGVPRQSSKQLPDKHKLKRK